MNSIFIKKIKKINHFFVQKGACSDLSGYPITESVALLVRGFSKRRGRVTYLCTLEEYKSLHKNNDKLYPWEYHTRLYDLVTKNVVSVVSNIPSGAWLFTDTMMGTTASSKGDIFDFADRHDDGSVVNNHCVHARVTGAVNYLDNNFENKKLLK